MIPSYIAGPFRGPTSWAIAQNVRRAEEVHLAACRLGLASICLHANSAHFQGECSDEFWIAMTLELLHMVARSGGILILVPGWEDSSGTRGEVREALRIGMPVLECADDQRDDPERLRSALRVASVLWDDDGLVTGLDYVYRDEADLESLVDLGQWLDARSSQPSAAQEPAAVPEATPGPSGSESAPEGKPGASNEPRYGTWIPVGERLPEAGQLVLMWQPPGEWMLGFLDHRGWWPHDEYRDPLTYPPTHWMPLPDPPEVTP